LLLEGLIRVKGRREAGDALKSEQGLPEPSAVPPAVLLRRSCSLYVFPPSSCVVL